MTVTLLVYSYGRKCFFTILSSPSLPTISSAAAKSLQSCLTLCDPIDGSPPGSAVPGILQERTLEWVAISFSNAWKWKVKVKSLSRVRLLVTPWTAAYQAPPPMGFSRQEYWSGVPSPSPAISSGCCYFLSLQLSLLLSELYQLTYLFKLMEGILLLTHTLHPGRTGGQEGPKQMGSRRRDVDRMITNI